MTVKRPQSRYRPRYLALAAAISLVGLSIDFGLFLQRTLSVEAAATPPQSDGLIVLTGSAKRLEVAVNLLDEGLGNRLLISGVHPDVKPDELKALVGGTESNWACCIDLDHLAETTTGNAEQAALWADANAYESLIVITADFHMPRSLIEFRSAMPDKQTSAVAVRSVASPSAALGDMTLLRRVFGEWAKWRVTQIRRGRWG